MEKIRFFTYGKINLALDVLGKREDGYHQVEMVMQQILLADDMTVKWIDKRFDRSFAANAPHGGIQIDIGTNRSFLPTDQRNIAYTAALQMAERYGKNRSGCIRIDIKKRIPVAAGLAGGSSNAAGVLHALNRLWQLGLTVAQLCELGSQLGSDVPYSIMGQAKCNPQLGLYRDPLATHCAIARGTGTDLTPIPGIRTNLLLSSPPLSVSTQVVYQGLDLDHLRNRPNIPALLQAMEERNFYAMGQNAGNVLESFTLKRYPKVMYTRNMVTKLLPNRIVMMSGSGPTIFVLCRSAREAKEARLHLLPWNPDTFWSRTTY